MRKNTPPNFTPPYDAFEAKFVAEEDPIINANIGIQIRDGNADPLIAELERLLGRTDGPDNIDRGWSDDIPGARTYVAMAYWRDRRRYDAWRNSEAVRQWFEGETGCHGDIGRWIETALIPPRGLDTLLARSEDERGLAAFAEHVELTPYHAYWGGTRDRIRLSEVDELRNPEGDALPEPADVIKGFGERVSVRMPKNVCVSRGSPDWSDMSGEERRLYLDEVHPCFLNGARYLRDNPVDAACYSCILLQEADEAGRELDRMSQIAYFVSLADIERWTKFHPTHKKLYASFMQLVRKIGRMPTLNLYHEVSVVPDDGLTGYYLNCDPGTGFMRFAKPSG